MEEEHLLFGITQQDWATTPEPVRLGFLTLLDMVKALNVRVKTLEAQVKQSSRNSSKPPSSDPPSAPPPPPRVSRGKKPGAQAGHPDQQRPFVPPDQVDTVVELRPRRCISCSTPLGSELPLAEAVFCSQVWDIPPIQARVTEYQQQSVVCPCCGQLAVADLPTDMPPGAFGPRATALAGLLHGSYRLSIRETTRFLGEVCGLALCSGSVVKSCDRLSAALQPLDAAVAALVQHQPLVWVDETGWYEHNERRWLWVAVSQQATLFRIDANRSQKARKRLLGEVYGGIVHSDRAKAYNDLASRQRQVCWAHLERNFIGLVDAGIEESWRASLLLAQTRVMWTVWHAFGCKLFDRVALQLALMEPRTRMRELVEQGRTSGWNKLREMCEELAQRWEALWTFAQVEGVEPTNNRAERALRGAVVWRKNCYGTQSEHGSRFVERMLSVGATCRQQGRTLLPVLVAALMANWANTAPPNLFPAPS